MLPTGNSRASNHKSTIHRAFQKVSVLANTHFLGHNALDKKRDSNKSGPSFDFQELRYVRSWSGFIKLTSAPLIVLLCIVGIVAGGITIYESYRAYNRAMWVEPDVDPMAGYTVNFYDRSEMIEVEQILTRAMQLDVKGNVVEYRQFLESTIPKYCLDTLKGKGFKLDPLGEENFHLNIRSSIHFVVLGVELRMNHHFYPSPLLPAISGLLLLRRYVHRQTGGV